jgi:hypothetical protein
LELFRLYFSAYFSISAAMLFLAIRASTVFARLIPFAGIHRRTERFRLG